MRYSYLIHYYLEGINKYCSNLSHFTLSSAIRIQTIQSNYYEIKIWKGLSHWLEGLLKFSHPSIVKKSMANSCIMLFQPFKSNALLIAFNIQEFANLVWKLELINFKPMQFEISNNPIWQKIPTTHLATEFSLSNIKLAYLNKLNSIAAIWFCVIGMNSVGAMGRGSSSYAGHAGSVELNCWASMLPW